ncbi:DNA polymerase III subunit delta' [Falsarthrobacter nasiphocae]|uniref:DNA polymerase-3 subunit delta n=1 Tax=Falsarthrobacter nasiphocae TaxID=189863 RepID=A0AAE4C7V6_9MICC|nr:DNA polymerase III subunit delta' [Falsarthrobacter nasiphocae]MDR6891775.1 DNA polymerase-3 subunit delta' [Falsarthrobacter nasiphocae]
MTRHTQAPSEAETSRAASTSSAAASAPGSAPARVELTGVWADLIGQERAVEPLMAAAASTTPHHAWLVTGPPGSGRSNAALAFAAALNCPHTEIEPRGCGTCRSCTLAAAGSHPDITRIATDKSVITIQEARDIVRRAYDRPTSGRFRVIVIEDADRMAERTTNVLLKAVEEPPPHTIWVLCTPSPGDVLVTIRSRCRLVSLRLPDPEDVARLLTERDGFAPEIARRAALAAQSHIGIARRLASDQDARARRHEIVTLPSRLTSVSAGMQAAAHLVALADSEAEASLAVRNEREKEELRRQLGLESDAAIPPALRAQFKRLEDEQARRGKRSRNDYYDRALTDLISWYRDLLIIQTGGTNLVNVDLADSLAATAAATPPESTLEAMETINATRRRLVTTNVAAAQAIEAMMMALLSAPAAAAPRR